MRANGPAELLRLCPAHIRTPLLDLPRLATALGIESVLAKNEGQRPLGSFKALGGVYAGLRALSRASGLPVKALLEPSTARQALPTLICASDGNHGLAVAAAARLAGARALVFLPDIVPVHRIERIAAKGAEVVRVPGTYDDAVRAAVAAASDVHALLVADTTDDEDDPVVRDVMAGYGVIADEVGTQLAEEGHGAPTHIFVQAGVGGFAAAMADGLQAALAAPARILAVEPETAACVTAAFSMGAPVTIEGELETSAEMLSCGRASAPALTILRKHGVGAVTVSEAALQAAPGYLAYHGGPMTTPSGAAGLAGLRAAILNPALYGLGPTSRVLLFVTENQSDVGEEP